MLDIKEEITKLAEKQDYIRKGFKELFNKLDAETPSFSGAYASHITNDSITGYPISLVCYDGRWWVTTACIYHISDLPSYQSLKNEWSSVQMRIPLIRTILPNLVDSINNILEQIKSSTEELSKQQCILDALLLKYQPE